MKRTVLALDLGTRMGWAFSGLALSSGVVSFARKPETKNRAADHPGESYLQMSRWLHQRLIALHPDQICFEEVRRWMGFSAAHAYGAYRGVLLAQAALFSIPCIGYSPTAIKKAWTGSGVAKKHHMEAEVRRRYPQLQLISDDQADALAILHHHLAVTS